MKKIAFVSNHPAPYRDPFLSRLVRIPSLQVEVFSLFQRDGGHSFWALEAPAYKNEIVVPHSPKSQLWIFLKCLRLFVFSKYDCVCWPGFLLKSLTWCMIIQVFLCKKYIICPDTVEQRPLAWPLLMLKSWLVRHAFLIFVPGQAAHRYFIEQFHVPDFKIVKGCYALDNKSLLLRIKTFREDRAAIRARWGIKETEQLFLMVANMLENRCYPLLGTVFLEAARAYPDAKFLCVGSGPDYEKMEHLAHGHSQLLISKGVSFDEMLALYAIADVYVHGGKEPASTALVIGAIAGLPILSSPSVGCSWDCLIHEKSGYQVSDYRSAEEWRDGFVYLLSNSDKWRAMGTEAQRLSMSLDVEVAVKRFVEGLEMSEVKK